MRITVIREDAVIPAWLPEVLVTQPLRVALPKVKHLAMCTKNRWHGRTLLEVYKAEYPSKSPEYYDLAFDQGRLSHHRQCKESMPGKPDPKRRRNMELLPKNHILTGNENIEHTLLLVEAVMPYSLPLLIKETESYQIISKPSGVPVYPQGPFDSNSLTEMLRTQSQIRPHLLSRLDRLTSGLIAVSKSGSHCEALAAASQKYYLTSWSRSWADVWEVQKSYTRKIIYNDRPYIIVECPLYVSQHEPGTELRVVADAEKGRPSKTIFTNVLMADENELIIAVPVTGRTHQIRVHSQYLGSPIKGDPLYDPDNLRSSKDHDVWLVVEYAPEGRDLLMSRLNLWDDIPLFDEVSLVNRWHKYASQIELEPGEASSDQALISGICFATRDSVCQNSSPLSDFGRLPDNRLVSFHPFVQPHSLPLHSFAWRCGDGELLVAPPPRDVFGGDIDLNRLIAVCKEASAMTSL